MYANSRLQTVVELVMHREALAEKLERIQTMRKVFAGNRGNRGRDGCRSIEFKSDYTAHVSISSTSDRELLQEVLKFTEDAMITRLADVDKVLAQAEEALGDIIEKESR